MNYFKSKDMDLTYREILKWGDKREAEVEPLMQKLIKEKFGLTDSDFRGKHLPGTALHLQDRS